MRIGIIFFGYNYIFCSGVVANLDDEDESNKEKKKKRKKNKIISENEDTEVTNEKYKYWLFITI